MATYFLDYEGGNDANDGTSFANRWKTITSGATAARIAPGDTIRIMASPDPTSLGMTATWTNKSATVTLNSALNALVDDGESAWTASANVTATADSAVYRSNTKSSKLVIAAGFTTGLAAYKALGASNNYSGYQGLTFWVQTSVTIAASTLSIRLCSDTVGAVSVNTIAIPAITQTSQWVPVYVDTGGALGAAIQSVALYCDIDPGAVTVYLDNINTVKASAGGDNLHLCSLIGKNTGGDETWHAIRSISGTTVIIDQSPSQAVSNIAFNRGYYGTTETVPTYKLDTIKLAQVGVGGSNHVIQDSGSAGNLITFSGGWDRTNMSTQSGITWWDQLTGVGDVIAANAKNYIAIEKLHLVRGNNGLNMSLAPTGWNIGDGHFNHNLTSGVLLAGTNLTVGNLHCWHNGSAGTQLQLVFSSTITRLRGISSVGPSSGYGVYMANNCANNNITTIEGHNNNKHGYNSIASLSTGNSYYGAMVCNDNSSYGVVFDISGTGNRNYTIGAITARNNGAPGLYLGNGGYNNVIKSLMTSGNTNGAIQYGNALASGEYFILSSSIAEATVVYTSTALGGGGNWSQGVMSIHNVNGVAGDHRNYVNGVYTVMSEMGANRHTASGIAWKISPLNTTEITAQNPCRVKLATFAVKNGESTTVKAWFMRDNTGLSANLVLPGSQIAGTVSDVVASASAGAGTYEQLSINFTPSEDGVVTVEAQCYGGTAYNLYVDDMSIT